MCRVDDDGVLVRRGRKDVKVCLFNEIKENIECH